MRLSYNFHCNRGISTGVLFFIKINGKIVDLICCLVFCKRKNIYLRTFNKN